MKSEYNVLVQYVFNDLNFPRNSKFCDENKKDIKKIATLNGYFLIL